MPLTEQLKKFCALPESERDYSTGALLLLQITGNKVQYRLMKQRGFPNFAELINKRLSEILQFRLQKITHDQVAGMKQQADAIEKEIPATEEFIKAGRRSDHDELPDEIQAAYKEALEILQKQRDLHAEVRRIAFKRCSSCQDSDMYPFVKEIIALDARRLKCWQTYDSFSR